MEVMQGYKHTEIGAIPGDWEIFNLGKSSTLKARIGWQGLTTAEYLKSGDYYLITGTDFKDGYIDWDNCVYVEKERYVQDKNIQVKVDDILVTKDGTIGKVAFVDKVSKETTLNSGVFVVRPINKIYNSRYLYYILMSEFFKEFLNRLTAGSTISHLYQKDFIYFDFPKPTLKEQTAIANALSDTDSWINRLEQLLAKKRQIKQGAMQELLQPKEGCEVKKLGEILDYIQPTPYLVTDTEYSNDFSIPVLTAGKTFLLGYTSEEFGVFDNLPTIIFDDFTTAIQYVDFPFKAKSSAMKMLVLKDKLCNLKLMFEIIKNIKYPLGDHKRHWIGEYSKIEIELPNYKEQTRIATILSDMDEEITQLETKLEKAKQIKQGMMQELLTGRSRLV